MTIGKRILHWLGQMPEQQSETLEGKVDPELSQPFVQVDQPIASLADDLFDRASFSRQIARTIAQRRDSSSLVIGLYGPWGDGKTSTLAMVKECLEPHAEVLTMDYNPWFYGDSTEAITRSFFHSIKSKLEKSGWFSKENIGELMAAYGKVVPKLGEAIHVVGESISTEGLIATRDRVGQVLRKHGKRIVIFIDDIDRLDRRDIQTLFKLVRLSGNFDNTTYILAFDDAVVAEALGESYGTGDATSGRRFLEKIVQVPLHLPPASPDKLREQMFAACDRVIAENNIKTDQSDGPELGHALMEAFGSALRTPRRVKLFDNAISFAVPILNGEVRVVDQILIEALRVFYPTVYDTVRRNPDQVLKKQPIQNHANPPVSQVSEAILALDVEGTEKDKIAELLLSLFPRTGQVENGSDWDTEWSTEKRVCSKDYFARYFTYGVPAGDIPDLEIDRLLTDAREGGEAEVVTRLSDAFSRGAAEILIRKLRGHEQTLDLANAPVLLSALAKVASQIPISNDIMFGDFTRSQAAILICQIVSRMEAAHQESVLASVARETDSLPFIGELMRWSRLREKNGEQHGFLTPERMAPLASILMDRLLAETEEQESNIIVVSGDDFGKLAYAIIGNGDDGTRTAFRHHLMTLLDTDPHIAITLLKGVSGKSQGGDGVVEVADLDASTYDSIGKLLDRDRIFEQLLKIYGDKLKQAQWKDSWDSEHDADRRIADQFAAIHLNPSAETDA